MNVQALRVKAPQLVLIFITLIWGMTFVTVKYGLNFSSPILFVALRFAAAAIAVGVISYRHLKGFTAYEFLAGASIGVAIAMGYATQTIGLQTISSSESAFLTALYVPLVPFFMWLIFKKPPKIMTWFGAGLACIGLIFLTGNGFGHIQLNFGQIITLLGAIAIAFEIILISYFSAQVNTNRVTVLQLVCASLTCFISAPFFGETTLPVFNFSLCFILVGLGLASAGIQLAMNWAQQSVEPSQAAIIYAGEPVWAAIIGRIVGDRLPIMALIGGCLVVLGIIVSEIKFKFFLKENNTKI